MKKILIFYRVLLSCLMLFFFGSLLYQNIVPSGKMLLTKNFCQENAFISNLYPEERVEPVNKQEDKCMQTFFNEPVYFKVKIPRVFNQAKVKIAYHNARQPIVQLGLLQKRKEPADWNFQLKLLENKVFDKLDWPKIETQGITLWQKKKRFDSIYQFVNNLPMDQKTVTFFYRFVEGAR